jgi:hypothetical protein
MNVKQRRYEFERRGKLFEMELTAHATSTPYEKSGPLFANCTNSRPPQNYGRYYDDIFVLSEVQIQCELNHARIAERSVVLAKGARRRIQAAKARLGERSIGHSEVRMIEEVEELGTKLEL